ncbi:MAG TPA: RimK family alpha-L-glutamate ligase [Clostridia bacterium]|nr:RimK family alpha-L-glutamate ligase [Clostridia bacterium]
MNGWIIYNGALRIKKNEILVKKLKEDGKLIGMDLKLIKNNAILPVFNENGQLGLEGLVSHKKPNFVIFWDKDTYLAKHLELMGYQVFNSSDAIKTCDNKALMHLRLGNKNIRMPKTIVSPFVYQDQKITEKYYKKCFDYLGSPIILKEAYGSFGMQVYKINSKSELKEKIDSLLNKQFIMQEAITSSFGKDVRVNIIGNEIIGAMQRKSDEDFRANITLGGQATPWDLSSEEREIALKAHKALGLDFSGVDLLLDSNNKPLLCEVNSNVNFLSFEKATGLDYGIKLLKYIKGKTI